MVPRVSSVSDLTLQRMADGSAIFAQLPQATKVCGLQNNTDRQYTIVLSQGQVDRFYGQDGRLAFDL